MAHQGTFIDIEVPARVEKSSPSMFESNMSYPEPLPSRLAMALELAEAENSKLLEEIEPLRA